MTDEILDMMKKRREVKLKNLKLYRTIDKNIRKKCRMAKESWLNDKCKEIEEYQNKHDSFNVHRKVKEVVGNTRKNTVGNISDEQGNIVFAIEDKLKIWQSYIQNTFRDDQRPELSNIEILEGPEITFAEVKRAIDLAKNRKAVGPDEVPIEILKLLDNNNIALLTNFFNSVYNTGQMPDDWLMSTFVTLPKKPNAKSCDEFRTISLMSHVLKIFLKVIHARLYSKCEENMGKTQMGFRSGLGTREALFATQVMIQRCRDVNCDVYICFLDYAKAFDMCNHEKMVRTLRIAGVDDKDIRIIVNLYWGQKAKVRVDGQYTSSIQIQKGVRQGCVLSPLLFNLYSEQIFRKALEDLTEGIKVNGEAINNIRYADDTILIADSLQGLQLLIDKVVTISEEYGLKLNVRKTKYMVISKTKNQRTILWADNQVVQRVSKFTYLGCTLNEEWDHSQEIKCRIEKARAVFVKMKTLLCSKDLSLQLKRRLISCYVYSVLLYGVEAWTISETMEKRIQAFEMWIYRRILKIPWTARVSNEEVLRRMNCKRELLITVKCRKLQYFAHIMRNEQKYGLLQVILQGKIEGKRGPGRRRISWLANLRKWFGATSTELFRSAINKVRIALMVANVRNG